MMGKGYPQQALDLWSPIFVAADVPAPKPKRLTLDERFQQYHEAHPEVFAEFRQLATQLLNKGHRHYGAGAIFEYIRFQRALRGGLDDEGLKLNNSYRSRYSRMLAAEDPRFKPFFEFRTLKS